MKSGETAAAAESLGHESDCTIGNLLGVLQSSQTRWLLGAALALGALSDATAQGIRVTPEIEASVTYTSNAAYSTVAVAQADWVITAFPRLTFVSRGGRVTLNGSFGAEAVGYANRTLDSVIRPRGSLELQSQLIERFFYVDASINVSRSTAEAYAPTPDSTSALNDYTEVRYRFSPYIQRELAPTLNFTARSDVLWSRRAGTSSATDPGQTAPERDATSQAHRVMLDRRPVPFGFSAEAHREQTEYRNAAAAVLTSTAARLTLLFAPAPQWTIGATRGVEQSQYLLVDRRDPITGGRVRWTPDERTALSVDVERRFFGTGVDIEARTRSPFFGLSVRANRSPMTQPGSHLLGAAGDSAAGLLDSILTTRYPDAGQRSALVAQLVRNLGLPETLVAPVDLFTNYAQLQEELTGSMMFYGRLTTVTLTGFGRQQLRLTGVEDALAPSALGSDNRQYGAEVLLTRRLSPTLTIDAAARHTRILGLGARAGDQTRSNVLRAGFVRTLTPSTNLTGAARHQWATSSVTGAESEYALAVGVNHRF